MEETKAKNVCHQMEIWKQLIDTELKTAANWEGQWGFLKGPLAPAGEMSRKGLSSSMPSLPKDKATEYFASTSRPRLDRAQALSQRNMLTPKERYSRQMITSHEVGWRPSLEKFGVSQHGVKRDPGIWPDY
mmetsp:Transcript_44754/g.83603  ORF Transcript_44754/g.83603 Transcript_44754/m.83603 type:complete len:131 (-) Transcript_44754:44-436(-)